MATWRRRLGFTALFAVLLFAYHDSLDDPAAPRKATSFDDAVDLAPQARQATVAPKARQRTVAPKARQRTVAPQARQPADGSRDAPSLDEPATRASARVMARLEEIGATLRTTRYAHRTRIDERRGHFELDCSGLLNHVLQPAAPRAFHALRRDRPVARTYARAIAAAPTDRASRGWQRVARLRDVRPGDVFAFERPSWWESPNTGHVGFFVSTPQSVLGNDRLYTVRIVDSTDMPHGVGDPRMLGDGGGYGRAEIALLTDASGAVIAFGWWGPIGPLIPIELQLGRVVR